LTGAPMTFGLSAPGVSPDWHRLQKVLIVDADPQAAERLERVLRSVAPDCRVSIAAGASDALRQLALLPLTLALVDIDLPGGEGVDLIRQLREGHSRVEPIAVSSRRDEAAVQSAISAGALGYLFKGADDVELGFLLRSVARGGAPIDPQAARRVLQLIRAASMAREASALRVEAPVPHADKKERLSPRELRILRLIAKGCSNRQIADAVFVSVNTIEFHAKSIYRKLAVRSRTQAVHQAQLSGLLC